MNITIEIAGVPVEIIFQYSRNKTFFEEYLSDSVPLETICPTEEDFRIMEEKQRLQSIRDRCPDRTVPPWYIENNAIHALLAEKLIRYNVLLIHGSAIVVDGEVFIFMADSGTGKSTHTRLWREHFQDRAWMLNDDKPMLKVEDGKVVAYGTPWDGKHHLSRNSCAPVRAFAEISRGETNHVEPISKADAMTLIYRYGIRPDNPELIVKAMETESQIARMVDGFHLYCNMDPEAAIVAYQGMTGGKE